MAYIHKSYVAAVKAEPENATVWTDGRTQKLILVIPETLGSFDGGAPVEAPGYGDVESRLIGFKFGLGYKDPNFKGNCPFYNSIKGSSNWHIAFRTEKTTRISGNPVSVIPKAPVTEDLNSVVDWNVDVKWSEADQPCPFDTPDGVFVCTSF